MSAAQIPTAVETISWDRSTVVEEVATQLVRDGQVDTKDKAYELAALLPELAQPEWDHFLQRISDWMGLYHSFRVWGENMGWQKLNSSTGLNVLAFRAGDLLVGFLPKVNSISHDTSLQVSFVSIGELHVRVWHHDNCDGDELYRVTKIRRG